MPAKTAIHNKPLMRKNKKPAMPRRLNQSFVRSFIIVFFEKNSRLQVKLSVFDGKMSAILRGQFV